MKLLLITLALLAFTNAWALNPNDNLSLLSGLGTVQKESSLRSTCNDGFERSLESGQPHSTIPAGFDSLGTPRAKWTASTSKQSGCGTPSKTNSPIPETTSRNP